MLVFFEAEPVALLALVLGEELAVGAEKLLITNIVRSYDPEMRFVITDFRTSPRRR